MVRYLSDKDVLAIRRFSNLLVGTLQPTSTELAGVSRRFTAALLPERSI